MSGGLEQRLGESALDEARAKYKHDFDPLWSAAQKMLSRMSRDDVLRLEAEFGTRGTLEAVFDLVRHVGGVGLDAPTLDPALALDSIAARAELAERKSDREWMERWSAGDARATDEYRLLSERAYPEPATEETET